MRVRLSVHVMADTCIHTKQQKTASPPPSHPLTYPTPHLEVVNGGPNSREGSSGSSTELREQLQCCV